MLIKTIKENSRYKAYQKDLIDKTNPVFKFRPNFRAIHKTNKRTFIQ